MWSYLTILHTIDLEDMKDALINVEYTYSVCYI